MTGPFRNLINQRMKSSLILMVLFCFSSSWALAATDSESVERVPAQQSSSEKNPVKVKDRKATLNFEDELVEGATQKPELFYLFQKKNFNYKRLIKLRENFLPEMRKTTEDLQRVRGVN